MAVIASLIGAGGLGGELLNAIQDVEPGKAVATGLVILALAFIIDRITRCLVINRRPANSPKSADSSK
jgi:ABC-type proline/glycine betaine transport system permease subunit